MMRFVQNLFLMLVLVAPVAAADSSEYKISQQVVERTMADLINLLKTTELPDDPEKSKEVIRRVVRENLEPVVDFRRIVKRIMGKHFADATKQQRNDFLDAFRTSLVNTYGKYLISTNLAGIASRLQYRVLPLGRELQKGRSQVNCVILFDSAEYEVRFSMYYNPKLDKWLIENMIVEGINLGINYRTQYDRLMVSYHGDYDKVIAEWSIVNNSSKSEG